MKIVKLFFIVILASTLIVLAGGSIMANELLAEFRKERQRSDKADINVDHLVTRNIPIGSTEVAARAILENSGFKIYRHNRSKDYQLVGVRYEKSTPPILNDEYRIVLNIEDGRVASAFARIFLQAP